MNVLGSLGALRCRCWIGPSKYKNCPLLNALRLRTHIGNVFSGQKVFEAAEV